MFQIYDNDNGNIIKTSLETMRFYGGEHHIKNTENSNPVAIIIEAGNDIADDLIIATMAAEIAHNKGNKFTLLLPYLPGARADRGIPFGAKTYANLVNSVKADKVIGIDPHSPVITKLLKNYETLSLTPLLKELFEKRYTGVISPDAGSRERSSAIANALNIPLIMAEKHRDFETSKLTGFKSEPLPDPNGRYLIVDDIADNGGTFCGLASVLNIKPDQLHLFVTHGVFGPKAHNMNEFFERIITTNSHQGHRNEKVNREILDVKPILLKQIIL